MGFPRQEYLSGFPFHSPRDLPGWGIEPGSPALAGRFFTYQTTREALSNCHKNGWSIQESTAHFVPRDLWGICPVHIFLGQGRSNWDQQTQKILLVTSNHGDFPKLFEGTCPHSSTLAWKIPWMEEPGRLQSMGSLRVGHDWATSLSLFTFMHWRRKWQPTPVFSPGESQGRRSLVGCRLWGRTESDTTEAT